MLCGVGGSVAVDASHLTLGTMLCYACHTCYAVPAVVCVGAVQCMLWCACSNVCGCCAVLYRAVHEVCVYTMRVTRQHAV